MVKVHKTHLPCAIAACLAGLSLQVQATPPACEKSHASDKAALFPCGVIVSSNKLAPDTLVSIGKLTGAKVKNRYKSFRGAALTIPNRAVLKALELKATSFRIFPDRPIKKVAPPPGKGKTKDNNDAGTGVDPGQVIPNGMVRIEAPDDQYRGQGIGVAIMDTGLDLSNNDLNISSNTYDAFAPSNGGQDLDGHGTHVGGIVAALDNPVNVVGVVPKATLYAVRVLDETGSGSDSDIIGGLDWVAGYSGSPGIRVVNMSLGRDAYPEDSDPNHLMRLAVQQLTSKGVVVVVSAGNESTKEITQKIPAAYPEVISVASTTATKGNNQCRRLKGISINSDTASYFTTDGSGVTISAPGANRENINKSCLVNSEGILSLKNGGGTERMSGTSMAAPHVTGVVAALMDKCGNLDVDSVKQIITGSAEKKGMAPLDSPTTMYSFDNVREGVLHLPSALGMCL